jgi:hypothetical protein
MIDSWFNTIVNIGGSTIGYAVGEGYLLTIPQVKPEIYRVDPEPGSILRLLQGFPVKILDQLANFGSTL